MFRSLAVFSLVAATMTCVTASAMASDDVSHGPRMQETKVRSVSFPSESWFDADVEAMWSRPVEFAIQWDSASSDFTFDRQLLNELDASSSILTTSRRGGSFAFGVIPNQ